MKKIVLGFILLCAAAISAQAVDKTNDQTMLLNEDIPDQYQVEKRRHPVGYLGTISS